MSFTEVLRVKRDTAWGTLLSCAQWEPLLPLLCSVMQPLPRWGGTAEQGSSPRVVSMHGECVHS